MRPVADTKQRYSNIIFDFKIKETYVTEEKSSRVIGTNRGGSTELSHRAAATVLPRGPEGSNGI
jgi:hypothetical protein